jgi:hypothetical protein
MLESKWSLGLPSGTAGHGNAPPLADRCWRWVKEFLQAHAAWVPGPSEIVLGAPEARKLVVTRGRTCIVRCVVGTVWITHQGNPGDHIVSAGHAFTSRGDGELVVTAFTPSRVAAVWSDALK